MALGNKRICYSCGAKFYDLEKEPAECPKCGTQNYLDGDPRTKRGRKQLAESVDDGKLDDIEVEIDDMEEIEEMDDDDSDVDLDIRGKVIIKEGDEETREHSATDDIFIEDVEEDELDEEDKD